MSWWHRDTIDIHTHVIWLLSTLPVRFPRLQPLKSSDTVLKTSTKKIVNTSSNSKNHEMFTASSINCRISVSSTVSSSSASPAPRGVRHGAGLLLVPPLELVEIGARSLGGRSMGMGRSFGRNLEAMSTIVNMTKFIWILNDTFRMYWKWISRRNIMNIFSDNIWM